jgi:DNA-binding NarL/FixJ family response regulator
MSAPTISILCVDDNAELAKALGDRLGGEGFAWRGHLLRADFLRLHVQTQCPDVNVVLLDLDMPGKDPLLELKELTKEFPEVRSIVFSGYCTPELLEGAVRAGAWGYVSKLDGEEALIEGIKAVMASKFYLSEQARHLSRTSASE